MCGTCTGMKRLDGMKCSLFPAFSVRTVYWEKAGAGGMELGLEIALVEGKEPLLPRRSNPAYECSERT